MELRDDLIMLLIKIKYYNVTNDCKNFSKEYSICLFEKFIVNCYLDFSIIAKFIHIYIYIEINVSDNISILKY